MATDNHEIRSVEEYMFAAHSEMEWEGAVGSSQAEFRVARAQVYATLASAAATMMLFGYLNNSAVTVRGEISTYGGGV